MASPLKTRKGVLSSSGSGDAGKVPLLGSDGTLDASFLGGFGLAESGSTTAVSGGGHTATTSVTYTGTYSNPPFVIVMPLVSEAVSGGGFLPAYSFPSQTSTGFTIKFDINEGSSSVGAIVDIPFRWIALSE
ncbi:hypothetical protein [Pseudoxanthomonas sp.]|uniref:hypothetical protein n=1 Tax=Pseudoxanthomonas sp. TaxID=1871049 RepID=UPI0026075CD1|nr:hypothetical protein [Pseudoxanthomonas sp.]WDS36250.1 MAG: hypothetical protein O8I58_18595 [Pseudoxanthomonas sp.]